MKLLEFKINNFKGIKDFSYVFNGKNAIVYGANGTGKTTLADALCWLWSGKDTNDQSDTGKGKFEIKEIGENGNVLSCDHSVYAKFQIDETDNRIIELQRIYKEKFNKDGDLIGHTTQYYLNNVPDIKESDYKEFIRSIIDEKKFKILTDPLCFAENLHWHERRNILFDICDAKTDQEILDSDKELSEINSFLDGHTIDECRTILKSKAKKIKDAKDEIPTRIDEAKKALKDISSNMENELKSQIEELKNKAKSLQDKKLLLENGQGVIDKKAELLKMSREISDFIFDWEKAIEKKADEKNRELKELESKFDEFALKQDQKEKAFNAVEDEIDEIEIKLADLRQKWNDENQKAFNHDSAKECYACKRPLPDDQIQEAYGIAMAEFNKNKSKKLEHIQKTGKELKASVEILKKDKGKLEQEISDIKNEKEQINKKAIAVEKQIENIKEKRDKYTRDEKYLALAKQEVALQGDLATLMLGNNQDEIKKIDIDLEKIKKDLDEDENKLLQIESNKKQLARIKDLEAEGKALSKEGMKIKGRLALLDKFVRVKVDMIEGPINSKFELAGFKLFNRLVNGELEICCEVTDKKGIPFVSNLNKGARKNIGLDIINTLSEHWGICMPIFIDDAEGVTDIIKTKGQQIKLYVRAGQENLRVLTE